MKRKSESRRDCSLARFPRHPSEWTKEQCAQAAEILRKKPLTELRRHQDAIDAQTRSAHLELTREPPPTPHRRGQLRQALADLAVMRDLRTATIAKQEFGQDMEVEPRRPPTAKEIMAATNQAFGEVVEILYHLNILLGDGFRGDGGKHDQAVRSIRNSVRVAMDAVKVDLRMLHFKVLEEETEMTEPRARAGRKS